VGLRELFQDGAGSAIRGNRLRRADATVNVQMGPWRGMDAADLIYLAQAESAFYWQSVSRRESPAGCGNSMFFLRAEILFAEDPGGCTRPDPENKPRARPAARDLRDFVTAVSRTGTLRWARLTIPEQVP